MRRAPRLTLVRGRVLVLSCDASLPGGLQELSCASAQGELLLLHRWGFPGSAEPSAQHQPASLAACWSRHLVWKYTAERQTRAFRAQPNVLITCFLGSNPGIVPTTSGSASIQCFACSHLHGQCWCQRCALGVWCAGRSFTQSWAFAGAAKDDF